ncbi:hypothetical protein HNY73_016761 [Argiope bruennichi]|uniref:C2H2-type domain-containing protein n=1 Tax=Argiope bruennichi TaxID=94029 RepID=A0A8T0EJS2_ARGBR|nr:hypothetical protein HNY73_016761 [Argiope bruennichi]
MSDHEKTSKWFSDCVKRQKHRRNKYAHEQGQTERKEQDPHLSDPASYSHCCYCIKVFFDAKFLVKHMLRRHSDKLVELHKNILSVTKSQNVIHESPDLVEFLKGEFSDLKVEVDYIKKVLADHLQEKNNSVAQRKSDDKPSTNMKSPNFDKAPINTKSDSLKYKQAEIVSTVTSNHISAVDFQNLQIRVDKLFQMFRETVVSKEDIEKTLALSEERICLTLKNKLLEEIKNTLLNQQKKNEEEFEAHYKQLKNEVDKLEKAVQLNSKKIESPDCFQEIQNKFESKIQSLLIGHSLFNSNIKISKAHKSKNSSNDQKLSLHKSRRPTKSIYTCKSVHNKCFDLSGTSRNKILQSPWSCRRKQKHFEDISHINRETILSSENNQPEIREQEKLHEFKSLVNNSENFSEKHLMEVKLIVEEKLRSLNIDPSTVKLSNAEFEKKMRLINTEKEFLEKKYENFSQIYKELNNHVIKVAKSKLRRKLPKKLRFSDSPSLLSPDVFDSDSAVKISCPAQKQESSGFILSSDLNAQGDACKNFDVENVTPIQENLEDVSERSYTAYVQQSSPQEEEINRKYSSANPVGYVIESNSAKKSSNSLLLKSVEEMSDLSSLESDILEDECDNLQGDL